MSLSMTDDNAIMRIDTGGESPSEAEGSGYSPDLTEPLSELVSTFERYIVLPRGASVALALWVLHTYMYRDFYFTPRLAIISPVKQCGKTSCLRLLKALALNSVMAAHVTPAAMFRLIASRDLTLLVDEADTFLKANPDYRSIINSGHSQDGAVWRCDGEKNEPKEFRTFGPVTIALIGRLPDTIEDRSIIISLVRKQKHQQVERMREDRLAHLAKLAKRCGDWVAVNRGSIAAHDPKVPKALSDRAADNWRPLLAIADHIGGKWPRLAREAALELDRGANDDVSHEILLLADIREIFISHGDGPQSSAKLLSALNDREDRPWSESNAGGPMTPPQLANRLRPFEITPKQHWSRGREGKGKNERGYELSQFADAFRAYLDDLPARPLEPKIAAENGGFPHQQAPNVGPQFARDSAEKAGSSGLAGNPGEAPSGEVEEASDGAA